MDIKKIQMDVVKNTIIVICSSLLAFLEPVYSAIYILMSLFLFNLLIGVIKNIIVNKDNFHFKKFIWAVFELLIYISIICGIYFIGYFQHDGMEAGYLIKVITYLYIYAYSTNILKNLIIIRPGNIVFEFLYYLLSLSFVKKIPYFKEFLNKNKNKDGKI